jgi:hypothetical protein
MQRGDPAYAQFLDDVRSLQGDFARIPLAATDDLTPFWGNGWLPPLDAMALYASLVRQNPLRYVEIGSGNSTKFARRAIRDHGLRTQIISIDPQPRAEIDRLCDQAIRVPFENVDLAVVADLVSGDVVFVDSSHRVLMNSDVTAFFLDVLPELPAGVFVHFHDIWLPYDYPERWRFWYFSEQYLLATLLLFAPHRLRVVFPALYVSVHPQFSDQVAQLSLATGLRGCAHGGSFWVETQDAALAHDHQRVADSSAPAHTNA